MTEAFLVQAANMAILPNLNLLNPNINVGEVKFGFQGPKINIQKGRHFYAKCGYQQHIPSEVYLFSNIKYTVYKQKHHILMLNEVINKTSPGR